MYSIIKSAVNQGIEGYPISIETNLQEGMPHYTIVGLPSRIIQEAKERVRAAISNCNVRFPLMRITQNLSPSQLKKEGVHMDLAIALGILTAQDESLGQNIKTCAVIGALTLDGRIEKVPGFISLVEGLVTSGVTSIIMPMENRLDETIFPSVTFYGYSHLNNVIEDLKKGKIEDVYELPPEKVCKTECETDKTTSVKSDLEERSSGLGFWSGETQGDYSDILGQNLALRALEIALAGNHNVMFVGPPGCGKTMILKRLHTVLLAPELWERIEISKIHGLSDTEIDVTQIHERPIVMPHHTISKAAMIGGGIKCLPGEVSKAHRGILALDELGEFKREVIEVLREPMSTGQIRLSKGQLAITYPADFQLIATMNPCFCGYLGSKSRACTCSPRQLQVYREKFSGPILDRIDMIVYMDRVENHVMDGHSKGIASREIKESIELCSRTEEVNLPVSEKAHSELKRLYQRGKISFRRFEKIKCISNTIARLSKSEEIQMSHIYEALLYDGQSLRSGSDLF